MKPMYRYITIVMEHPEIPIDPDLWSRGDHRRTATSPSSVMWDQSSSREITT